MTVMTQAENIYNLLTEAGIEIFWDDRQVGAGIKLSDADLLGLPFRLIVSPRTVEKNLVEVKRRIADDVKLILPHNLCALIG